MPFDEKRREELLGRGTLSDDDAADLLHQAVRGLLDRRHAGSGRFEGGDAAFGVRASAADRARARERQSERDERRKLVEHERDRIHDAERVGERAMPPSLVIDDMREHRRREWVGREHPRRVVGGQGRPLDDRLVLQGILFVLHTGIGWEHLPQELGFGSGMTGWRRLRSWLGRFSVPL